MRFAMFFNGWTMKLIYFMIVLTFPLHTAGAQSPWGINELVGKNAPDLSLRDINDKTVSLSSLRGNVVLINFWATWCPPCRAEMSSLNKLYKEYKGKGFTVVAVSKDRSVTYVKDYLSKNPVDFPILMDFDNKASKQFRVFSLPTSFLLDKNGVITELFLGEEEWDSPKFKSKIKAILGIK